MNFRFVSELIRGEWAIDPQFALNAAPIISSILNGHIIENSVVDSEDGYERTVLTEDKKSVAVLSISGPLMKDDKPCGPIGMESIGAVINKYGNDPRISAIVLKMDSPGGTVNGTETLSNIIKGIQKPVITYVSGMMASAALWIGSAADEVFASTELDRVGSVGVLLSFADMQPVLESQGVKFHNIVSNLSPDKQKWFDDLRAGKYEEYIKNTLDPIALKFQQVITENRPKVTKEHLTGKIYFAKDVMGVFVDQIGTLDDAVNRAAELASERSKMSNSNKTMNYLRLQTVLGEDSMEFEADGRRTFTEEEMQTIEDALAAKTETVEKIPQSVTDDLSVKTAEIESLKAQLAERDEQIKNLMAAPAVDVREVVTESDAHTSETHDFLSKEDIELYNKIKR